MSERPARAEPLAWVLFSGGGIVAALAFPVHVAVIGIAYAFGWLPDDALSYDRIVRLVHNPLTKIYLVALVALPLWHFAHRFRYALHHQLGVHGGKPFVATACYGTALAGTVLVIVILAGI